MKRPLAAAGFAYLAAQLIAVMCGLATAVILGAATAAVYIGYKILISHSNKAISIVMISAVVSFGAYSLYNVINVMPVRYLEGRTVYIEGKVTEEPYTYYGRYYYELETTLIKASGAPQKVRMLLSSKSDIHAEADNIIKARVVYSRIGSDTGMAYRNRMLAEGSVIQAYIEPTSTRFTVVEKSRRTLYGRIIDVRVGIKEKIDKIYRNERVAALIKGMLLGDTSGFDETTLRSFRRCGLSHYLAVSGMHLSIVMFVIRELLKRKWLLHRARAAAEMPFVLLFMALTGFSPSVMRAGLMLLLSLAAQALFREADTINSLGFALLVICFLNPYAAADAGLLLSTSATLGIALLYRPVKKQVYRLLGACGIKATHKLVRDIVSVIATSVSALIFTAPVAALCFDEISVISIPANLVCTLLADGILIFGMLSVLLICLPVIGTLVFFPAALGAWLCAKLMLIAVDVMSFPEWVSLGLHYKCLTPLLVLSVLMLVSWYYLFGRTNEKRRTFYMCAAMIAVSAAISLSVEMLADYSRQSVYIFDTGDNIACVVNSKGRSVVLCAGGEKYSEWEITETIDSIGCRMDSVFILDSTADGSMFGNDIVDMYSPDKVFAYSSPAYEESAEDSDLNVMEIRGVDHIVKNTDIEVRTYAEADGLLWCYVHTGSLTVMIAPEDGDCAALPYDMRFADVLVCRSEKLANIGELNTALVVISADEKSAADAEAVLRFRGVANTVSTASRGSIRIVPYNDGVMMSEVKQYA